MFMKEFFEDTHEVHTAGDVSSALDLIETHSFDVALVDYRIPGGTGLILLCRLAEKDPQCGRYLLSATDIHHTERAKAPPYSAIAKGIRPKDLIEHVLSKSVEDVE